MDKKKNSKSLFSGTFNPEHFWKDQELSMLPSILDIESDAIVSAMDEMQFVFCDFAEDLLITRYSMDASHRNYLRELGFAFSNCEISFGNSKILTNNQSVCQLLLQGSQKKYFKKLISNITNFCQTFY